MDLQDTLRSSCSQLQETLTWNLEAAKRALKDFEEFKLPESRRYQYRPLETNYRHIRLIRLISRDSQPTLRLQIEHVPLDKAPPYEALSYCWGDNKQPHQALVETAEGVGAGFIPLTASLSEALAFLPGSTETQYLWIDQICINQADTDDPRTSREKGHQIGLMGDIYGNALKVLGWLGPGPSLDCDQEISVFFKEKQYVELHPANLERALGVHVLSDALHRPWLSRAWVVQEASLARNLSVLLGLVSIEWIPFSCYASNQWQRSDTIWYPESLRVMSLPGSGCSPAQRLMESKTFWGDCRSCGRDAISFCRFLASAGRHFEATNPKDKVLAFLSFSPCLNFIIDDAVHTDKCAAQTYTRLARAVIQESGNLDILAAVTDHGSDLGTNYDTGVVPSWVPSWQGTQSIESSPIFQLRWRLRQDPHISEWDASLCRGHKESSTFPTTEKLHTRGRVIGKIDQLFPHIQDPGRPCGPQGVSEFQRCLRSGETSIPLSKAVSVLLACRYLKQMVTLKDLGEFFDENRVLLELCSSSEAKALEVEDKLIALLGPSNMTFFWNSHLHYAGGRRFFEVSLPHDTGFRVGLAPPGVKETDVIAILHGASFPVVLRKVYDEPQTYTLVGDCYVDGIMLGEAVDWAEENADDIILV